MNFKPDYNNMIKAARNIKPDRMPLYEHIICVEIMEKILGKNFADLLKGNRDEKKEFFRNYTNFFKTMGYDTVSFEGCITEILPGGGALGRQQPGVIKNREDFKKYPWESVHEIYFNTFGEDFEVLGEVMPDGMKAIGGVGNGVFECVQDLVGYMDLCYISVDDPELYADLFEKVASVMRSIWSTFLRKYGDIYAVCRFGDDLGFNTSTLISAEDIKTHIIPQYKSIVEMVHSYNKPFLLHSCGNIFDVMEDIINIAKIDAKHSNEDGIAPFSEWVERYGNRIGNFGGIDTDTLCQQSQNTIKERVKEVVGYSINKGGFALGCGNSIPNYVPVEGYLAMVEMGRKLRGE
ncbi:hypothetical protein G9F72_006535 [Clostridium estertheticum]|uniref:uroporphyrinogen decarboxylase family protein n=1 Tax=Clostridium estertheticum TaxID=238834 RepID=UPI0013E989A0|nr:uroporphyrinogen decarboxylase family protein [Clostridium estertheticum]MBZ9685991.1 hypothetical protein [Clostridium estertheticum]